MSGNGLTPFAWIFMLTSMISVTVLVVWCFFRILTSDGDFGGGDSDAAGGRAGGH